MRRHRLPISCCSCERNSVNAVYLDYHATTPVDPRVLEAMLPFFTERFGNPHSKQHAFGWDARYARTADGLPVIGPHRNYPFHLFAFGDAGSYGATTDAHTNGLTPSDDGRG